MTARPARSTFLKVTAGALAATAVVPLASVEAAPRTRDTVNIRFAPGSLDPVYSGLVKRALAPLKAKGFNIAYEPQPSDIKLITQIATGSAPDVYVIGDQVVQQYANKGAAMPLDDFLSKDKILLSTWYPFFADLNIAKFGPNKGRVVAIPSGWADMALIYNKDLFLKAKIPFPTPEWTWDDFLSAARELTLTTSTGRTTQFGAQIGSWFRPMEAIVWNFGGDLCNKDGTKVAGYMNSPQTIAAVQWYVDLVQKYRVMASPAQMKAYPSGTDLFGTNRVAMVVDGSWGLSGWRKNPTLHFGVADIPRNAHLGIRETVYFEGGWGINPHTSHPNEAWEIIKALSLPAGDAIMSQQEHLPVTPAAVKSLGWDKDHHQVFLRQTKYIRHTPNDARGLATVAAVADPIGVAMDHLLSRPGSSVKATLDKAASDGEKALTIFRQEQG